MSLLRVQKMRRTSYRRSGLNAKDRAARVLGTAADNFCGVGAGRQGVLVFVDRSPRAAEVVQPMLDTALYQKVGYERFTAALQVAWLVDVTDILHLQRRHRP